MIAHSCIISLRLSLILTRMSAVLTPSQTRSVEHRCHLINSSNSLTSLMQRRSKSRISNSSINSRNYYISNNSNHSYNLSNNLRCNLTATNSNNLTSKQLCHSTYLNSPCFSKRPTLVTNLSRLPKQLKRQLLQASRAKP